MSVTKLQASMLIKIAESEYNELGGGIPQTAEQAGTWANVVIDTPQDKGVITSLINAELVNHSGSGEDAVVGLTDAGFEAYKSLKQSNHQQPEQTMSKNLQDLLKQQKELETKIAELLAAERGEAIERCKADIATYGLTADDLGLTVKERKTRALNQAVEVKDRKSYLVVPKYRNPADYNQTWSGRGRKPHWVETFISNGGELEKLLIKD